MEFVKEFIFLVVFRKNKPQIAKKWEFIALTRLSVRFTK